MVIILIDKLRYIAFNLDDTTRHDANTGNNKMFRYCITTSLNIPIRITTLQVRAIFHNGSKQARM